ncbi:hypothetical protein GCM10028803_29860 [Larkinella knui]|uniref:Uncharacterized protein n=1 Tax=Larkinella knui TaxID=2025310 RepID=A0A3P1CXH4_9BACT|nr:hypothetical protein [Larkinella knui]RRB18015.1 hypothetical protein EHT87_07010 [Larkinella knui]
MDQPDKFEKLRTLSIAEVDIIARRSRDQAETLAKYNQSLPAGKVAEKVTADSQKWMEWALLAEEYLQIQIRHLMT